jgi:mycothiol system anti-sigma-R factor
VTVDDPGRADCGCDDVLRDVWLFLDDEMNPDRRAVVQQHIDECSPCLAEAGFDSALKSLLSRKCGGDKAPEELKARLLIALRMSADTTTAVTAQGSVTVTRAVVQGTIIDQPD